MMPVVYIYRRVEFQGKCYRVMHHGPIPEGFEVDHIDHNGLHNLLDNFRLIPFLENSHNRSMMKSNTSGVTGIHLRKNGKWRARIGLRGRKIDLGTFDSKLEAIKARKEAKIKYGYHSNHGKGKERQYGSAKLPKE